MTFEVSFTPEALDDLFAIYRYIAEAAGADVADGYQARLRKACLTLAEFPNRATPRDDLAEGLRTIPFERRAVIAFRVEGEVVSIVRVLHRGRELGLAFD
ncbi:MAG: type II toxin-antitoxin system RelE/ParE family toxin [Pseudomonadota bacterium]|nr:type II toxin-antitoxin system RelE/ParE family toxin [Pseudomonadota bacterium]